MDAEQPFRIGLTQSTRDDRSPITTLRDVAVVVELLHELGDRIGHAVDVELRLGGGTGEAVPGHGRHDDVERVGGLTAVGLRVGEGPDDVEELHE